MALNPTEEAALARLQADWPDWEIWLVPAAIGRTWWCARLKTDPSRVLNARSGASSLAEQLAEASR